MCRWFDSAPGHQIANPNSYELGFFIGRSDVLARVCGGSCAGVVDFGLVGIWQVLRLFFSLSPISLCRACIWQRVEVHNARIAKPMKSTSYVLTNQLGLISLLVSLSRSLLRPPTFDLTPRFILINTIA